VRYKGNETSTNNRSAKGYPMETSRMNRANKQQDIGIIKIITLTPLILIGLVILAFIIYLTE